jgi:hypothetical protein
MAQVRVACSPPAGPDATWRSPCKFQCFSPRACTKMRVLAPAPRHGRSRRVSCVVSTRWSWRRRLRAAAHSAATHCLSRCKSGHARACAVHGSGRWHCPSAFLRAGPLHRGRPLQRCQWRLQGTYARRGAKRSDLPRQAVEIAAGMSTDSFLRMVRAGRQRRRRRGLRGAPRGRRRTSCR